MPRFPQLLHPASQAWFSSSSINSLPLLLKGWASACSPARCMPQPPQLLNPALQACFSSCSSNSLP